MVRVPAVAINGETSRLVPGLCVVVLPLISLWFLVQPAASQETALSRAEAFVAGLSAFRAHVAQRYHDRAHDRDLDIEGELALSRPSTLTVRFADGRGLSLSGTSVVAYDPDVGEHGLVHERTLDDDRFVELRGLLAGTTTIAAAFDVRELGPSASGSVLEVRPRTRIGFDRALLSMGEDGLPARLLVVDEAGNTLRWVLSRAAAPRSLPPRSFALPIPDAAERIRP